MSISNSNNDKKKFVILTQPRSGSYFFQSLLDSAEDIACHGEIFKADRVELSDWYRKKLSIKKEDISERDKDPVIFLNRLRNLTPYKIFGFKAFNDHIQSRPVLKEYVLMSNDWKKIFLIRNPVYTYASLLRAKLSGKWVLKNDITNKDQLKQPIVFKRLEFDKHLKTYLGFISLYKSQSTMYDHDCFLLQYHQLENCEILSKVLKFIGSSADAFTLQSEYKKQFEGDISESFSNFKELETYLIDIGCKELLDSSSDYYQGK